MQQTASLYESIHSGLPKMFMKGLEMFHDRISSSPVEEYGTYSPNSWTSFLIECSRRFSYSTYFKLLSSLCRRLALSYFIKGPIDYQFFGAYARFQPQKNLAEKRCLLKPAAFDSVEFEFMKSELSEGDVFLDVGANVGFYSLFASGCVKDSGRVLSFEPNPVVFERLLCNVQLNSGRQGMSPITPIQVAVTDKSGKIPFVIPVNNLGEGRVDRSLKDGSDGSFNVEGKRLLDILEEYPIDSINILKIDIEGHEINALAPFFETAPVSLHPKFIIIERGDDFHWKALSELFQSVEYQVYKTCHMNVILKKC